MGKCLAGPIPIAPRAMKTAVPSYFPQLIDVLNLISGNCEPQFVYLIPVILKPYFLECHTTSLTL